MAGRHRPFARALASAAVMLGLLAAPLAPSAPAAAAPVGSDFDAGYIISDGVFFDSDAMTEAEVQAFLNARVPNCVGANDDTTGVPGNGSQLANVTFTPGQTVVFVVSSFDNAAEFSWTADFTGTTPVALQSFRID